MFWWERLYCVLSFKGNSRFSPKFYIQFVASSSIVFSYKVFLFQWVGPIEDLDAEFAKIDKNGGGQILFSEFVDWALEKDLDIEDDVEPED